jgi:hypothetical protein
MAKNKLKVSLRKDAEESLRLFSNPLILALIFFIISLGLSIVIFLRLTVIYSTWFINLNSFLYFLTYYILPELLILWGLLLFNINGQKPITNKRLAIVLAEWIMCILALAGVILAEVPDYYFMTLPLIVIISTMFIIKNPKRFSTILLIALLIVSFFMPLATAFLGSEEIIRQAAAIDDKDDQVRFIAQMQLQTTASFGFVRASTDFEKLLLSGDGACGEGATFMIGYLTRLGFEVRAVAFPGEDHEFVEIKINSTWLVVDPGYHYILVTEQARGTARVQEAGTLTYVAAYNGKRFTELTQQYTSTDTVLFRVTAKGEPVTDAAITLVHTLVTDGVTRSVSIPGNGLAFHTDTSGIAVIHLGEIGPQTYKDSFTNTDSYYSVYLDGKPTEHKVTSFGNGTTTELSIGD